MKLSIAAILSAAAMVVAIPQAKAITCYALTDANHLLRFDSATPGTATDTTITTSPAGYSLLGIDFRTTQQTTGAANPGPGSLWAIGVNGMSYRLFIVNPSTGAANGISGDLALNGGGPGDNGWGFGFDPAKDRIRFFGFTHSYSIDPNTFAVQTDPAPVVNGSIFHNFNGAAYTTASFGGTSQFYSLDDDIHDLVTSADLSASGTITPVGPLGFTNTTPNGLDIYEGLALWVGQPGGTSSLFSVNLSTGAASMIGNFMGNPTLRAIAILPSTFPPILSVTVKIKGGKKVTTSKTSLLIKGTATSGSGITLVQYKIGKGKFKKAKGTTSWKFTAKLKPGTNTISVQATGGNGVVSSAAKVKVVVTP